MAARTNYLIAIRDLVGHVDDVEIPIYLCDSILTPAEYGTFLGAKLEPVKELKTAAGTFLIPTDIASNRKDVAKYAEELERAVRDGYSGSDFLQRCKEEGLTLKDETVHEELFQQLVALAHAKRNGVWARIIKNAFAPLFVGEVDYVVGNPPWVNWESLPGRLPRGHSFSLGQIPSSGTREFRVTARQCQKGAVSQLFVYATMDHYLPKGGSLGFVITQSIFKSGACEGFRRFSLDDKRSLGMERSATCRLSAL